VATELIRGLYNITPDLQGGVVTIGNFDGVHLGHQALILQVKKIAARLNKPSIVVTFEPQPLEFFATLKKDFTPAARLTKLREKFSALAATGVDKVVMVHFDEKLASQPPSEFISEILVKKLHTQYLIVGDDFRFGAMRKGDFELLRQKGQELGFIAESLPSIVFDNERVSSTRVRKALIAGDLEYAKKLLARPYTMMGRVVHGDKLGRKLGFPTANIYLHRAVTPIQGIFAVRVHGIESTPILGAANVGIRPTVGGTRALLEVYLLNFNRDIYGKHVTVEFCKKIRDEERYNNLDILKNAIANDVIETENYFKSIQK